MLIEKVKEGPLLTLEITPPNLPTIEPVLEELEGSGIVELVDGFTITDSPLSRPRMGAIPAGFRVQSRFQKPAIVTISMRDRNLLGLYGDILGANELGLTNLLLLTGDPVRLAPLPVKGVFEGSSLKLFEIVSNLNRGLDLTGTPLKIPPKPITPFGVTGVSGRGLKRKLLRKVERGMEVVISQPVYSVETAEKLLQLVEEVRRESGRGLELILGFFPITSLKVAQFLKESVPGVEVPDRFLKELELPTKEAQRERGIELSRELFRQLQTLHPKLHLMSANRFDLLKLILER
jgi:5,10-methylenetetrahydrofolate reductase